MQELTRTAGNDRFGTNVALVTAHAVAPVAGIVVVNGESSALPGSALGATSTVAGHSFFNALLAGPFAARTSASLLLTERDTLPQTVATYLETVRDSLSSITLLGDLSQISQSVEEQLRALL